ncbi:hypothetical protein [Ruminococcus sp.]|uniref:hypothetical protein n=1 Tax=Ruminococcus sp. TaxID=41978 RepID=UPI0025D34F0F|nr:hypothetical protein [Ruminococcus sp.]
MKKITVFILTLVIALSITACTDTAPAKVKPETIGTTAFTGNQFSINGTYHTVNDYYGIEDSFVLELHDKGYNNIDIYDTRDITENLLASRIEDNGIIVERAIGIVTNAERQGDGKILNAIDGYDYISYNGVDFQTYDGTIILTYLVYNPNTTYTDDIIERYDFCLDREFED